VVCPKNQAKKPERKNNERRILRIRIGGTA
jgi:hypothetical protein